MFTPLRLADLFGCSLHVRAIYFIGEVSSKPCTLPYYGSSQHQALTSTLPTQYDLFPGILPAEIYWDVLEKISSHGFVVIGIWTMSELPTSQIQPEWLKTVKTWLQVNFGLIFSVFLSLTNPSIEVLKIKHKLVCELSVWLFAQIPKLRGFVKTISLESFGIIGDRLHPEDFCCCFFPSALTPNN